MHPHLLATCPLVVSAASRALFLSSKISMLSEEGLWAGIEFTMPTDSVFQFSRSSLSFMASSFGASERSFDDLWKGTHMDILC